MNTSHMKLAAIALVAWAALGATSGGASVSVVVMILLVLLAVLETGSGETGKKGDGEKAKQRARLWRWGFYGLLMGLSCWVLLERQPGNGAAGGASSLAASRGWPVADPAVANHAPGAAGRCACGKPLGHDKTAAPSPAEAAKRVEALKKRTMNPTPKGIPTTNLPGIGPNAKPLAPGLVPNANAKLPPGVEVLNKVSGQRSEPQANPPPAPTPSTSTPAKPETRNLKPES